MNITSVILLTFLIACALAVSFSKNLLSSVLILMGYSTVMSVIWLLLESPDLAITEAAVGAGVTTILFFVTFRRIGLLGSGAKSGRKNRNDRLNKPDTAEAGKSGGSSDTKAGEAVK